MKPNPAALEKKKSCSRYGQIGKSTARLYTRLRNLELLAPNVMSLSHPSSQSSVDPVEEWER